MSVAFAHNGTNNTVVKMFQSSVWRYFTAIKPIFCIDSQPRMKHGSSTSHMRRKNSQNNGLKGEIRLQRRRRQFYLLEGSRPVLAARFFFRKFVGIVGERPRKSVFFRRPMATRWRHKRTWPRCTCARETDSMMKWWRERLRKSSLGERKRERSRLLTSRFCQKCQLNIFSDLFP